ncbi:MAG: peptidylprolyl isomerase [Lachnospiraceae bacterium]|nr:peptidylprolyl isomerase [Lachnospiraceae bacterium]
MLAGCSGKKSFEYQFSEPKSGDTIAIIHTTMGDITVRFFPDEAPKAVENFITHAQEGYYDGVEFFRVIDDFMIQGGDPTNTGRGGESIWGGTFEDELCEYLSPYYGALCMANKGAYTGTNGSQFFIVTTRNNDTTLARQFNEKAAKAEQVAEEKLSLYEERGGAMWLDYQIGTLYANNYVYTASTHCVFGQVLSGMEVAEAIAAVETYSSVQQDEANIKNPGQTTILQNKPVEPVIITSIEITNY